MLTALDHHPTRAVYIVARRSAADVRFSPAELMELEKMTDVDLVVDPAELVLSPAATARCDADRTVAARVETFGPRGLAEKE